MPRSAPPSCCGSCAADAAGRGPPTTPFTRGHGSLHPIRRRPGAKRGSWRQHTLGRMPAAPLPPDRHRPLLHVVLRTTPGENRKNRPAWYTKDRCIASVLIAVQRARAGGIDVRVTAIVDISSGRRMPAAVTALLDHVDAIVAVRGGTAARSWRPALRAVRRHLAPAGDDLIYLVEDDHLHRPDALTHLVDGGDDYRLLYALASEHGAIVDRGDGWAHVPGGTSTFAVRGDAFRADAWRHVLMSYGGGAWDELSWRILGSHVTPPGLGYVRAALTRTERWPRPWGLRPLRHAAFRLLCLALARRDPRSIGLRTPIQATHCEHDMLADTADWAELAYAMDDAVAALREDTVTGPVPVLGTSRRAARSLAQVLSSAAH